MPSPPLPSRSLSCRSSTPRVSPPFPLRTCAPFTPHRFNPYSPPPFSANIKAVMARERNRIAGHLNRVTKLTHPLPPPPEIPLPSAAPHAAIQALGMWTPIFVSAVWPQRPNGIPAAFGGG